MAVRNKKKVVQTKKLIAKKVKEEPQPHEVEEDDSGEQSEEETVPAGEQSDNDDSNDEEMDNPATSQESEQAENSDGDESLKTTIFVGHIKYNIAKQELEEFFGRAGEITSVRIIPKKGFAFVSFADEKSVEKAMKFNNEQLKGREVHVEKVKTKQSNKKKQRKRKLDEENQEQKAKKDESNQPAKKRRFNPRWHKKGAGKNKSKPGQLVRAN